MTPSCQVIRKLEQALAGELRNGAVSIRDVRYNEGRERFPLHVIAFNQSSSKDIIAGSLAEGVLTVLEGLGWDVPLPFMRGCIRSTDLTVFEHAHRRQCCNADIYLDVAWSLPKGN
ncbi:hypothetical protein BDN71DRAFT_1459122 [Pleurotus eryngii]|uniref:Uncharacterized protein n=1 Tax=Pleurotus eryngii TaxID=5323 RepID=A0A9P5ZG49_PLEER|nr:hypothetical protein BDN71DRAFT_1459122 [Pleurotus eryngii]